EERLYTPVGLRDVAPAAAAASEPPTEPASEPPAEPAAALSENAAAGMTATTESAATPRQEQEQEQEEDHGPERAHAGRSDLAWPWLLGPLLAAQVWLRGDAGRRQALQLVAELDPLLSSGAIGTIAERVGVE